MTEPSSTDIAAFVPPREPRYDWGLRVRAATDLLNDGSYPGYDPGALLIPAGTVGEIVRVGHVPDTQIPVYLVEFSNSMLIGCLEEDVAPLAGAQRLSAPGRME